MFCFFRLVSQANIKKRGASYHHAILNGGSFIWWVEGLVENGGIDNKKERAKILNLS
jgi:hypothetical protein